MLLKNASQRAIELPLTDIILSLKKSLKNSNTKQAQYLPY